MLSRDILDENANFRLKVVRQARLCQLGWQSNQVTDDDLGRSGGSGTARLRADTVRRKPEWGRGDSGGGRFQAGSKPGGSRVTTSPFPSRPARIRGSSRNRFG